ncbi:protein SPEAR1-like [Rutidosis leptorrhynchoides]|uniref:protein SPEAR1-like n=1 Tax=Rutidosis leptorrhynchoides TaxID=125765 RepID=UPI003A9A26FB
MNYFNGNERSCYSSAITSGSSSRKGKKSSGSASDKQQPRQPQRGLGVAQLEKIRLHTQMGGYLPQEDIRIQTAYSSSSSSSSFSYPSQSTASFSTLPGHHSHMMQTGMGEFERPNIVYGESHISSINHRWDASCGMFEAQGYAQPAGISRHLFSPDLLEVKESLRKNKKKDQNNSMGSSSYQNSDSNGNQELDLELRLSL